MTRTTLSRSKSVAAKARTTPAQAATDSAASHPTFTELAQTCRFKPERILKVHEQAGGQLVTLGYEDGTERQALFTDSRQPFCALMADVPSGDRWELADKLARREVLPDGNVRHYDPLFNHAAQVCTPRGKWLRHERLVIPPTHWTAAGVTAVEIFRSALWAMQAGGTGHRSIAPIRNLLLALGEPGTKAEDLVKAELADLLAQALHDYMLRHDWQNRCAQLMGLAEEQAATLAAYEQAATARRVERSVAARRARQAAKAAAAPAQA